MGRIQRNKSQGMIVANVYINIYIRLLNLIIIRKCKLKGIVFHKFDKNNSDDIMPWQVYKK